MLLRFGFTLFGGIFGHTTLGASKPSDDRARVLAAISKHMNLKVPRNQCDINGTLPRKDGTPEDAPVWVRDIFIKHALWSLKESPFKVQGFDCEPHQGDNAKIIHKSGGLLSCRWWYGEQEKEPQSPGWSVSMVVLYDPKKDSVNPTEIECIKIP